MIEEVLINASSVLTRVARVDEGELIDLAIEPASRRSPVGNIYLGHVLNVVPGLRAAFVGVGLERDGFLSADDARQLGDAIDDDAPLQPINELVREGDAVLVQVARDAFENKGARLTSTISFPGRTLIYSPHRSGVALSRRIVDENERNRLADALEGMLDDYEGVIVRTNAEGAALDELSVELDALRQLWRDVSYQAERCEAPAIVHADLGLVARAIRDYVTSPETTVLIDDAAALADAKAYAQTVMPGLVDRMLLHTGAGNLFDRHDVEDQVAEVMEPHVALPGGGRITIESTAALTAIDVDSGGRSRDNPEEAAAQTNIEAADEVGRQLRLRGIGGAIVIDFIQMRRRANADRVVEALQDVLHDDPAPTDVGTLSRFGLLEMTRRRAGPPLSEIVSRHCPTCDGLGRIGSAEAIADHALALAEREVENMPGGSLTIVAAPDVISVIENVANTDVLGQRLGCTLLLRGDKALARDHFDIIRGD